MIWNQALEGNNQDQSISQLLSDFIDEELESETSGTPDIWDWDYLRQYFSSHILVDVDLDKLKKELKKEDLNFEDISNWIKEKAGEIYKARESLLDDETMKGFERFDNVTTIDDKWKDHLYGMDQLERE